MPWDVLPLNTATMSSFSLTYRLLAGLLVLSLVGSVLPLARPGGCRGADGKSMPCCAHARKPATDAPPPCSHAPRTGTAPAFVDADACRMQAPAVHEPAPAPAVEKTSTQRAQLYGLPANHAVVPQGAWTGTMPCAPDASSPPLPRDRVLLFASLLI